MRGAPDLHALLVPCSVLGHGHPAGCDTGSVGLGFALSLKLMELSTFAPAYRPFYMAFGKCLLRLLPFINFCVYLFIVVL